MKLFIGAHLDDIEIGCGAYLSSLSIKNLTDDTHVIIFSEGRLGGKSKERIDAFKKNMEILGIKNYSILSQEIDTFFDSKYEDLKLFLTYKINKYKLFEENILEVYFNSADNHKDHELINRLVKETFRPFMVNKLVEYEIPSSNLFNTPGDNFNWYYQFDRSIAEMKGRLIYSYKNISLFDTKDARDIDYTLQFNKLQGNKIGKSHVERYNILYTV